MQPEPTSASAPCISIGRAPLFQARKCKLDGRLRTSLRARINWVVEATGNKPQRRWVTKVPSNLAPLNSVAWKSRLMRLIQRTECSQLSIPKKDIAPWGFGLSWAPSCPQPAELISPKLSITPAPVGCHLHWAIEPQL